MTLQLPLDPAQAQAVKAAEAAIKASAGYHRATAKPNMRLRDLSAVEEMYSYYGADRA